MICVVFTTFTTAMFIYEGYVDRSSHFEKKQLFQKILSATSMGIADIKGYAIDIVDNFNYLQRGVPLEKLIDAYISEAYNQVNNNAHMSFEEFEPLQYSWDFSYVVMGFLADAYWNAIMVGDNQSNATSSIVENPICDTSSYQYNLEDYDDFEFCSVQD